MGQCDAKSKHSGQQCQRFAMIGKTKCPIHGGKSLSGLASPTFKNGQRSKTMYLPANFTARLESVVSDHIENIEHSIAIQKALETTYLEKLNTGESTEAWNRLKQAVKEYEEATANESSAGQSKAFAMIRSIVIDGLDQSRLYRDIQNIQESQRKLSETLSKVRKEAQEIYTQEQWNEFLAGIVQVLKNNISDRKILEAIQNELFKRSQQNPNRLLPGGAESD